MPGSPTIDAASLRSLLKASPLFNCLDEATIYAVEQELEFQQFKSGTVLFNEGDPGDSLYLVIHGRLRVLARGATDGPLRAIREIGQGETVGEIALITGEQRSATVCAIRDTGVVRFSRVAFEQLIKRQPQAMLYMIRLLVGWIRDGEMQCPHQAFSTLALVPLGPEVPTDTVCREIEKALREIGSTLLVTAELVDRSLGTGSARRDESTPEHGRIAAWLDAREIESRYLVLVADAGDTPWTRRCVRHADRVLYVGRADAELPPGAGDRVARWEEGGPYRPVSELLLLQAGDVAPANAGRWLDRLRATGLHRVRPGKVGDYRRLARRLTGNAIALVLGGGGARGFAHIGVLRALREAGVEIDAVGCASMGALMGAQFAMGWSVEEMVERNRAVFLGPRSMHDYTLPLVSLVQGRRIDRALAAFFGETLVEDLFHDYFCVSTNLSRADLVVHRRGTLRTAVRASISVPGILPPVFRSGELLVDGGVLNNLPVDVMCGLHQGDVIAVEVSPEEELTVRADWEELPSVPWLVLQSLGRGRPSVRTPGIFDILMRSATIGSTRAAELVRSQVSLYLHPPIEAFGMTEWEAFDRLVEIGYISSQAAIEAWLRARERPS